MKVWIIMLAMIGQGLTYWGGALVEVNAPVAYSMALGGGILIGVMAAWLISTYDN